MEVIGIEKDGSQHRWASITKRGREFSIDHLEMDDNPPKVSSKRVVTGVASRDILVRHLSTSLTKKSALKKSLAFQLEPLIAYPLDEVMIKPNYRKKDGRIDATFIVAAKEAVRRHLETWDGVDPDEVSSVPMALMRFGAFTNPDLSSYTVFHMGYDRTSIVFVQDHAIYKQTSLKYGLNHFISAYKIDAPKGSLANLGELDLQKLSKKTYPALMAFTQKFWGEVDRTFCFLFSEFSQGKHPILFTGVGVTELKIDRWVCQYKECELLPIQIQNHRGFNASSILPYAIPIGLAIDSFKKDDLSLQLRQGDFISMKTVRKGRRSLFMGGVLSLICAFAFFITGKHLIDVKEERLQSQLMQRISEYESALPALGQLVDAKGLEKKVALIDTQLKFSKMKDDYYAEPPRVSRFIDFLSHHPFLEQSAPERQIEIKHIRYEVVEHPTLKQPLTPYKIAVKLEFSCADSGFAREFHDALVMEKKLLEDDEKVEWNRNEDEYEIAFYLKNH